MSIWITFRCDVVLSYSDQPGWSLSSGGPPAGFWPGVICHRRVRRQPRLDVINILRVSGTSEFLCVKPLNTLFYMIPSHRVQEEVANRASNGSNAPIGSREFSQAKPSIPSSSELSTTSLGVPLVIHATTSSTESEESMNVLLSSHS